MSARKEIKEMIKAARKAGWIVTLTNGGHWKWQNPNGDIFYSALTPSDRRALLNMKAYLRRMGT